MGIVDLFRGSKDERIAKRLIAAFRAAGETRRMKFVKEEDAVVVFEADGGRANILNLVNLRYELAHTPDAEHDSIFSRFAKGLISSGSSVTATYSESRPHLRIALRDAAYGERTRLMRLQADPAKQVKSMLSRPFAGDLAAYCVVDRDLSIEYVTQEQLATWEIDGDQAMADAYANTRAMSFSTEGSETLHFVKGPNGYNTSCLAITDGIRKLSVVGATVAAAATRDSLTITGSEDMAGLSMLAQLFEAELKDGNRLINGRPLVLTDSGWEVFQPPESLRQRFADVARQYDALFWNDYKELLAAHFDACDEDIFVATLTLFEESGSGSFSAVVWSRDVDTILPPADRVFFYDPEDESTHLALWADVTRVMGSSMKERGDAPRCFRVEAFPSASQLMEMGAKRT